MNPWHPHMEDDSLLTLVHIPSHGEVNAEWNRKVIRWVEDRTGQQVDYRWNTQGITIHIWNADPDVVAELLLTWS